MMVSSTHSTYTENPMYNVQVCGFFLLFSFGVTHNWSELYMCMRMCVCVYVCLYGIHYNFTNTQIHQQTAKNEYKCQNALYLLFDSENLRYILYIDSVCAGMLFLVWCKRIECKCVLGGHPCDYFGSVYVYLDLCLMTVKLNWNGLFICLLPQWKWSEKKNLCSSMVQSWKKSQIIEFFYLYHLLGKRGNGQRKGHFIHGESDVSMGIKNFVPIWLKLKYVLI